MIFSDKILIKKDINKNRLKVGNVFFNNFSGKVFLTSCTDNTKSDRPLIHNYQINANT